MNEAATKNITKSTGMEYIYKILIRCTSDAAIKIKGLMLSKQRDMIKTPLSRYGSFKELAIPVDKVYEFQNFFSQAA